MRMELRIGLGKSDTNDGKWGTGTTELEGGVKILFFNIVKKHTAKTACEDEMSEITKDAPVPLPSPRLPFALLP